MANLRILFDNIADNATISASSYVGNLVPANLKSNKKSQVWRSVPGPAATITCAFSSPKVINCIALPFNNLSSLASIKVTITNAAGATVFTRGPEAATRGQVNSSGSTVNAYSYGQGNYSIFWLDTAVTGANVIIELTDPSNISGYIECSRLVIGEYWSPKFNTGFGMSMVTIDTSTADRNDSGDYVPVKGTRHRQLSFDLTWMDASDRNKINSIANYNGTTIPLFISLFPKDTDPFKEQIYQIYGFLMQEAALTHTMHTMYSTRLEITEY